jgi:hypothetical protein
LSSGGSRITRAHPRDARSRFGIRNPRSCGIGSSSIGSRLPSVSAYVANTSQATLAHPIGCCISIRRADVAHPHAVGTNAVGSSPPGITTNTASATSALKVRDGPIYFWVREATQRVARCDFFSHFKGIPELIRS